VTTSKIGTSSQLYPLIAAGHLPNLKIDEASDTVHFLESEEMSDIISAIEDQNLEMVKILTKAREVGAEIKTSQEYAKIMVRKQGGDSKFPFNNL
jgi:hypothetical protein